MRKIVVGVDGSASSQQALRWARKEAALHGEPLEAVMAWGYLDQHHHPVDVHFEPEYQEADAHRALAAYVTDALGPDATDELLLRPVCDLPARALLAAGDGAAMLIVGARGRGGFAGLLLGSVSQKVIRHAPCPVAVIRRTEDDGFDEGGRIVVGVDGSEGADAALRWALEEGRRREAGVDVVHAWHMPFTGPYPYMDPSVDLGTYEKMGDQTLDQAIQRAQPTSTDRINPISAMAGAAGLLLETAKGADLVVVGSRGLSAVRASFGSVSQQVAMHAPCPVVVIPGEQP